MVSVGKNTSVNSKKTFVITSAQQEAAPHKGFEESIKRYLDDKGAEFVLLDMQGRTVKEEGLHDDLNEYLDDLKAGGIDYRRAHQTKNKMVDANGDRISLKLNENIQIGIFNVLPQMDDPVTSLDKYASSDAATIFASPKMRMKIVPNGQDYPKVLITTGALTLPSYRVNRQAQKAWRDHRFGAVIVEIDGNKKYHFRHVEAVASTGAFTDLGMNYSRKGIERIPTKALVLGDWHVGDTSEEVRDATFRLFKELNPEKIFLHDFFNGHSINHHERENIIMRVRNWEASRGIFEDEVKQCYDELQEISKRIGDDAVAYVVASNHHDFITKYLKNTDWVGADLFNYRFSQKVIEKLMDGAKDPLYAALSVIGELPKNVKFLDRNEDHYVKGYQLAKHGDKGGNGARGSLRGMEKSYAKVIHGHTHVPERLRDAMSVGTSTDLRLEYNTGDSGWLQSHAAVYGDGKAQHINIIDGKYHP